jgi:hypothetical protein
VREQGTLLRRYRIIWRVSNPHPNAWVIEP